MKKNDIKDNSVKKKVTSTEIAAMAGVSRAVVSLVMNNVGGTRVSAETRKHVLAVAKDMGYQIDAAAATLRKGFSNEIAVFYLDSPYCNQNSLYISKARAYAESLGYTLAIYFFKDSIETTNPEIYSSILARRPAGIISNEILLSEQTYHKATRKGVRCFITGSNSDVTYGYTLKIPMVQAYFLAMSKLFEDGHKNLMLLVNNDFGFFISQNESVAVDINRLCKKYGGSYFTFPLSYDHSSSTGVVQAIISHLPTTTAVIGSSDICFKLLKSLKQYGLRIPDDIALVGIGDSPFCELSSPTLTSVHMDSEIALMNAVEVIDRIARNQEWSAELLEYPPPVLIIREST